MMNKKKSRKTWRIHTVSPNHPSLKGGWVGMNYYAARSHKKPWPYGKNDIVIKRGLRKGTRKRTIKHEIVEIGLMRRGKRYSTAHPIALKREKED